MSLNCFNMEYKNVSFIIPSYNCENIIVKTIKAVLNQNYNYGKFELIVIDDGSTDNSLNVVREFKKDKRLRIIDNGKNLGYIKSLNKSIKASKYELVCLVICDQVLNSKYWLKEMVEVVNSDEKIAAAASIIEIPDDAWENYPFIIKVILMKDYENQLKNSVREGKPDLFKKDILKEMGFYDERFNLAGEDSDLRLKLLKKGYKIKTAKNARLLHYHGDYYKDARIKYELFRKALPLAEAAGVVYRKHGFIHGRYWNHISSTIIYFGLLFPYIRYISLVLVIAIISLYTYKVLIYTKSWKTIFIPFFKLVKDIISIFGFWKGYITGKQTF